MTGHEYRSGSWTALVTDDALALLHPAVSEDVARELWQLTATGTRLGAWVEYLAAAGIAALPSFAMVEAHPQGLRVLVRGEVEIEQDGRVLSGRGLTTWREDILPAADLTVRAEATGGGWLPITGGIVRAAAARLVATPRAVAAPTEDEEDVELTVARMPALAAAVGVRPVAADAVAFAPPAPAPAPAPPAPAPADAPATAPADAPATAHGDASAPFEQPAATTREPAPPVGPDADAVVASRAADADATAMADPSGAALPGEEDPEDSDDYDFLLWSTDQVRAHQPEPAADDAADTDGGPVGVPVTPAAAEAEPRESVQPDLEATREPEPEAEDAAGPFAPGAIIDSVPGRPRPAASAGTPVDLPPPAGPPADAGSYDDGGYDDGDHDGETIATSDLPATSGPIAAEPVVRPAPGVELVLSTGPRIEMDRPVLLGRAPEATRFAGTEVPRLVSVSNPERDISATHVEVRPAGGHVVVTDMNSTNGTVVHLPDQPSFRLQPGTGVPVGPGAVIEVGVGVEITVERVEGAQ